MLHTKLVNWTLGIWAAITFAVCVIYGLVTPQSLHMSEFLEMVLPAFKWLTWWGFLLRLVESFLYGVYAGLVFCPIYNWLYRCWGPASSARGSKGCAVPDRRNPQWQRDNGDDCLAITWRRTDDRKVQA